MTTPTDDTLLRKDEQYWRVNPNPLIALLQDRLIEARTLLAEREAQLRKYGGHTRDCALFKFQIWLSKQPDGEIANPRAVPECTCDWSAVEATLKGEG